MWASWLHVALFYPTAREYVHINRIYCDRELYRVHLVKTVKELDVNYVGGMDSTIFSSRISRFSSSYRTGTDDGR